MAFALTLLSMVVTNGAASAMDEMTAKGILYVSFNMGVGSETDSKLGARFVPDKAVFSPSVGSPESTQPGNYFNINNPSKVIAALVGQHEMIRLSRDPMRVVAVPATVVLSHRRRVMECDAPADYVTVVSAKALAQARLVSREVAPIGC